MNIIDAINLPIRTVHTLYTLAIKKSKADEQNGKEPGLEEMIEEIEEGG